MGERVEFLSMFELDYVETSYGKICKSCSFVCNPVAVRCISVIIFVSRTSGMPWIACMMLESQEHGGR